MTDISAEISPWHLTIEFPTGFHSLGLHLPEDERENHLSEVASSVWPRGTDFQRETVLSWYTEIAADAAAGGAFYGGFCIAATDDHRVTTASLLGRLDPLKEQDATVSAAGITESLSRNPACDVARVESPCGPAVLAITGVEWTPPSEGEGVKNQPEDAVRPVPLARADLYVPVSVMGQLLVLSMTTPSLAEFPDYVGILSHIAQSISVQATAAVASSEGGKRSIVQQVHDDFG